MQASCQLKRIAGCARSARVQTQENIPRIFVPSEAAMRSLARALESLGLVCAVEVAAGNSAQGFLLVQGQDRLDLPAPLRLGVLAEKLKERPRRRPVQIIEVGQYSLDLQAKTWTLAESAPVVLTDREVGLLQALLLAPGYRLERAALLQHVWSYHESAETHTLETHIYRLRRKIEGNASTPTLLLTDGSGYKLSL